MNSKREFVFGVDLDGVCADYYKGIREIAAEWLNVNIDNLTSEPSYGFPEWGFGKKEEGKFDYQSFHRYAVARKGLFERLPAIGGASVTLRRLSDRGIRIRIITHRLFIKYFHKDAVTQTIEWLDNHDIPYWDICFMSDKSAVGADLYIDDTPDNIENLRNNGHDVIIFTNSTNKTVDGIRANNWSEVEMLVLEYYEKWKS